MHNRFENTFARMSDFRLHGVRHSETNRIHITGISIQGRLAVPSPSFWKALLRQFDVAEKSVRDLDKDRLFQELLSDSPDREVEFGMTTDDDGNAFLTGPILDDFSADPDAAATDWAGWESPQRTEFGANRFTQMWGEYHSERCLGREEGLAGGGLMEDWGYGPRPSMN